ncbi:hypothetical protein Celaphus_00005747 [Cervus elaphus hippelaphus]|uniref:Uncharacterized protein n=1 Tax=Cervus elaphus hippelaphus TaxID=46360 RepID=A0A212CWJ0_CEREH|nr:hypothetical protein Celaphus_00005747 [Cervus elaphus hippelaphus]
MSSQLHSLTHFSDIGALTGGTPHLDEDQNPKKRKKIPKKGRKKKENYKSQRASRGTPADVVMLGGVPSLREGSSCGWPEA